MGKVRNLIFYSIIIALFSTFVYWIFAFGKDLEIGRHIALQQNAGSSSWHEFLQTFSHNCVHPLAILLAQIVTVIIAARALGWVFKKIGQPSVIGEIAAGIMLGPSFLGMYFPALSSALFPPNSLGNLQYLSQIGLILFMFMVGMELDLKTLKNKAGDAFVISQVSIIIPFSLGACLAYFIYSTFAPQGIKFSSFALFMGIAMSITAFPVLARIVHERNIHKSKLGAIVITSAAVDDVTAWCLLAAVIAIVKAGSFVSALYMIGLAIIYVLIMIMLVRPFLKRIGDLHGPRGNLNKPVVALFFLALMMSSFATEIIGIHALFGAFMAGAIMPDSIKLRSIFIEKVEDISLLVLLPLFFVYTGLRTQIGLLNDIYLWQITGLIILVAIVGKFVGSAIAAKFVGQSWRDSLSIGALMNTRGLMELVVLNIGYDLGVLGPEIFAMMVIMALVTTFMTGPSLDFINNIFNKKNAASQTNSIANNKYRVLISFANPEKGKALLRLAHQMAGKMNGNAEINLLHLSPNDELNQLNIIQYEKESFAPVIQESKLLDQNIQTIFKVSSDINTDITETANKGDFDMLLVGLGRSIYEGTLIGKILGFTSHLIDGEKIIKSVKGKEKWFEKSPFEESTRLILTKSKIPVGILIDKHFTQAPNVLILVYDELDLFLLGYALKFIHNASSKITVYDPLNQIDNEVQDTFELETHFANKKLEIINEQNTEWNYLQQNNLLLISIASWTKQINNQSVWLVNVPSTLIIKP